MKKKLLIVLLCSFMVIGLTGCGKKVEDVNENENTTTEESSSDVSVIRAEIDTKISETHYQNVLSVGVNRSNTKVVVELVDNSKEAQDDFCKNVHSCEYIEFKDTESE